MRDHANVVLDTLRKNGQTEFTDAEALRDFVSDQHGIELSQAEGAWVLNALTGWAQ